jgi:REP element-mobilizing transposase RayT
MYLHIIKRGGRGLPIVADEDDRWRYLKCLYYLNDRNHPVAWERDVKALGAGLHFQRPESWVGDREPYVDILSYCLMDNHYHLFVHEREEGDVAAFMKSLNASMTQAYNEKKGTDGSIFGGPPKKKFVEDDVYLKFLYVYVNVKNLFERYPEGIQEAIENFDDAWNFALEYDFSSLPDCAGDRASPIVSQDMFRDTFSSTAEFKKFAREQMHRYGQFLDDVGADNLE